MVFETAPRFGFVFGFVLLLSFALGGFGPSAAQEARPRGEKACRGRGLQTFARGGAIADVLKEALKAAGL